MGDRAILQIDVADDAFTAFTQKFADFTQSLRELPQLWSGSTAAIKELVTAMDPLTKAVRNLNRALGRFSTIIPEVARATSGFNQMVGAVNTANNSLRETANLTTQAAANCSSMTRDMARWPQLFGQMKTVMGFFGVGVSIAGARHLMNTVVSQNQQATGAGMAWDQLRAIQTASIGTIDSPQAYMNALGQARFNIGSAARLPFQILYGRGAQAQLTGPGGETRPAAGMEMLDKFYKRIGNVSDQTLLIRAQNYGIQGAGISNEDIIRMRPGAPGSAAARAKFIKDAEERSKIPADTLTALTDLSKKISALTTSLESKLAVPLGHFADSLTGKEGVVKAVSAWGVVAMAVRGATRALLACCRGGIPGPGFSRRRPGNLPPGEHELPPGPPSKMDRLKNLGSKGLDVLGGITLGGFISEGADLATSFIPDSWKTKREEGDQRPTWQGALGTAVKYGAAAALAPVLGPAYAAGAAGYLAWTTTDWEPPSPETVAKMKGDKEAKEKKARDAIERLRKQQEEMGAEPDADRGSSAADRERARQYRFAQAQRKRLGLRGFQSGTERVTQTGLALIHEGEQIVPGAAGVGALGSAGLGSAEVRENTTATDTQTKATDKLVTAIRELTNYMRAGAGGLGPLGGGITRAATALAGLGGIGAAMAGGFKGGFGGPKGSPRSPATGSPGGRGGPGTSTGSFMDTIAQAESGNRNIPQGIHDKNTDAGTPAEGYFQIITPTWRRYAQRAGVDLSKYPNAMSAPREVQAQVAAVIPFREWGKRTRDIVHRRFGAFDESMTAGQLQERFGGGKGSPASPATGSPGGTGGGTGGKLGMTGVDPRIPGSVEAAARDLGYDVRAHSGREGRHDPRSFHGKGMAEDFVIYDAQGRAIPNRGMDPTGMYSRLARQAMARQQQMYPELTGRFAWGGAFGTQLGGGGQPDLMHFDIGGERGRYSGQFGRRALEARYPVVPFKDGDKGSTPTPRGSPGVADPTADRPAGHPVGGASAWPPGVPRDFTHRDARTKAYMSNQEEIMQKLARDDTKTKTSQSNLSEIFTKLQRQEQKTKTGAPKGNVVPTPPSRPADFGVAPIPPSRPGQPKGNVVPGAASPESRATVQGACNCSSAEAHGGGMPAGGMGGAGGGLGQLFQKLFHVLAPKPLDPANWSGSGRQVQYTIRNAPGANIYTTATGMGSASA